MGGEQSTFILPLRGNGKLGIAHNLRRAVVLAIGNVGIVDGSCWRLRGLWQLGVAKGGDNIEGEG